MARCVTLQPFDEERRDGQRFLYDVCEPYIRFWRRILPFSAGPFDFSPMVAVLALIVLERIVFAILGRLH